MRNAVILMMVVLGAVMVRAAIVNNSTIDPTSEDSVSFIFLSLDSLGGPAAADSVIVVTIDPSGEVIYQDSMSAADTRITTILAGDHPVYAYAEQVSVLDGPGGAGCYKVTLLARSDSLGLLTPNVFSFQIVEEELSDQIALIGDSVFVSGGIIDSNRSQGPPLDSTMMAGSVWNALQADHTASGTFGRYLDAPISGLAAGSGVYSYTIRVFDSGCGEPVPGVGVAVRNVDQSALLATGTTDNDGAVALNLNAAAYVVIASAPGYLFAAFDTIEVEGPGTDTVFGSQFFVAHPPSPTLCRVYGFICDVSGQPEESAAVRAYLPSGIVRSGNRLVSPFSVVTSTDSLGYFYIDLIPSDSLVPQGSKYEVSISRSDGTVFRRRVAVPDSLSWRLSW